MANRTYVHYDRSINIIMFNTYHASERKHLNTNNLLIDFVKMAANVSDTPVCLLAFSPMHQSRSECSATAADTLG